MKRPYTHKNWPGPTAGAAITAPTKPVKRGRPAKAVTYLKALAAKRVGMVTEMANTILTPSERFQVAASLLGLPSTVWSH